MGGYKKLEPEESKLYVHGQKLIGILSMRMDEMTNDAKEPEF